VLRADQVRNLLDHLARLEGGVIPDVIPDGVLKGSSSASNNDAFRESHCLLTVQAADPSPSCSDVAGSAEASSPDSLLSSK